MFICYVCEQQEIYNVRVVSRFILSLLYLTQFSILYRCSQELELQKNVVNMTNWGRNVIIFQNVITDLGL